MLYAVLMVALATVASCCPPVFNITFNTGREPQSPANGCKNPNTIPNCSCNPHLAPHPPSPSPPLLHRSSLTDISVSDGAFVIQVNRTLAPKGAERMCALAQAGFFATGALFRVVPGFVLQFGISGNATQNKQWLHSSIPDDPVVGSNVAASVAFADAGPNTRSTQIFVNFADNSRLDKMGFAPFGHVVSGMDVVLAAHNPTPNNPDGLAQRRASLPARSAGSPSKSFPSISPLPPSPLLVVAGVDQDEYEAKGNTWIRSTYPGINFVTNTSMEA